MPGCELLLDDTFQVTKLIRDAELERRAIVHTARFRTQREQGLRGCRSSKRGENEAPTQALASRSVSFYFAGRGPIC